MGGAPPFHDTPIMPHDSQWEEQRTSPRPQLPVPRPIIEEDAKMEELLKQFQQVRIGTTEHAEWQRWAMTKDDASNACGKDTLDGCAQDSNMYEA